MFRRLLKRLLNGFGRILAGISPELASRFWYLWDFKRPLNLKNPTTLNEKLMWLKLNEYRDNPLVTQCADKYRVREYVQQTGCGEILNELYAVWDTPDQIDWERLPTEFVLKCTHGCGYNIICQNKEELDIPESKRLLKKWLDTAFWKNYAEIQYKDIKPRIICERMLGDGSGLTDYKIYCFHGKPLYILVCLGREKGRPRFYFFDSEWQFCPITKDGKNQHADFSLPKPHNMDQMLAYAERLAAPFPFVRVDFYDVNGKVLFGELTFTPSAALDVNRLPETDRMFGELLHLEG